MRDGLRPLNFKIFMQVDWNTNVMYSMRVQCSARQCCASEVSQPYQMFVVKHMRCACVSASSKVTRYVTDACVNIIARDDGAGYSSTV